MQAPVHIMPRTQLLALHSQPSLIPEMPPLLTAGCLRTGQTPSLRTEMFSLTGALWLGKSLWKGCLQEEAAALGLA